MLDRRGQWIEGVRVIDIMGSKGSELLILCVKGLDILYRCFMAFVMVRFPRLNLPRIYQHVVQRGGSKGSELLILCVKGRIEGVRDIDIMC